MKTIRLAEWTSRECRDYLLGGGDLALVPVASVERLGPHLPLGSRITLATTLAELLAEANHGVCLPPVPYTATHETTGTAGTVSIDPKVAYAYLWDICHELVTGGFHRVVFTGWESELYYVVAEYFQEHDVSPSWLRPDRIRIPGVDDGNTVTTALIAAAYRLSGREQTCAAIVERSRRLAGAPGRQPSAAAAALRSIGVLGGRLGDEEWTVRPVADVPVDAAVTAIREFVESRSDGFAALHEYNHIIARSRFERGVR